MSEPKRDPIEELCVRWTKERIATSEVLHAAIPAIRALQERVKLLEHEMDTNKHMVVATVKGVDYEGFKTSSINYLQRLRILVDKEKKLKKIESKLARVIEAGNAMAETLSFFEDEFDGDEDVVADEIKAWRNAVSE